MSSVKVLCADLPGLIKRMVCALCETNIAFRHSIEITGSLHIKADETRVLALLLDHVASKPPPAAGCGGGYDAAAAAATASGDRLPPSPYSTASPGAASPPAYGAAAVQQQHQRPSAEDPPPRYVTRSPQVSQSKQPPAHAHSRSSGRVGSSSGCSAGPRSDWGHHGTQPHRSLSGRSDGSKVRARLPSADAVVDHGWHSPRDAAGRETPSHDFAAAATAAAASPAMPSAGSSRRRAGSLEPAATVTCSSASVGPTASGTATQLHTSSSAGSALSLSQLARRLSENASAAVPPRGSSGSSSGSYGNGPRQPLSASTSDARERHGGDSLARDGRHDGRHERGGAVAAASATAAVAPTSRPPRPASLTSPPSPALHQLYGRDSGGGGGGSGGGSAAAAAASSVAVARPVPPLGGWVHAYRNAYQKAHRKNGLSCHTCTLCGMHFQRAPSLAAHINAIHTRERSFKCELCNKVFFRRTAYCNHRRAHHQPGGGGSSAALGSAVIALAESMQLGAAGGGGVGYAADGAYTDGADEGDGGGAVGMDVSSDVADSKDGLLLAADAAAAAAYGSVARAEEGRLHDAAASLADTTGGGVNARSESDLVGSPSEEDSSAGSEQELLRATTVKHGY